MRKAARVRIFRGAAAGVAVALAVTAAAALPHRRARADGNPIDPRADQIMRRMSDSLAATSSFGFDADHVTEVVLRSGQKLAMAATSRVRVQRPDKMRSDRRGEVTDVSLFYDGHRLSLVGYRNNFYATTPAPPTLDAAIDFARERLHVEAPAADLLFANVYRALMENVLTASYVDRAEIDGVACHHLAFRGRDVDWQLWVEVESRSLPRRYTITSKNEPGAPEFTVTLRSWVIGPTFPDDTFVFQPPLGTEKIDFLGLPKAPAVEGGVQ